MVRQDNITPAAGSKHSRKRIGRGYGSGHGGYATRGCKGQKSRAGNNKVRPGFEGGQLPIIKRLPRKRGFVNIFRKEYAIVNIGSLNAFAPGSPVTPQRLWEAGLVDSPTKPVKILGDGELRQPLDVQADKFSAKAQGKIEAAGGKAEVVAR